MQKNPDYRIYPSLMMEYQNLLDYELVAEEVWNRDSSTDGYKLSPEEMYVKLEADLIDSINRVESGLSTAADKGTAFNEIVDCLVENRKSNNPDCEIKSCTNGNGEKIIRAEINGNTFDYDLQMCKDVAADFTGSLTQYPVSAIMHTCYGDVELYGYMDEWKGPEIADIKTTSQYKWGKYAKGWQRHVYPWCAIESGLTNQVDMFTYYVVLWAYQSQGAPLRAKGIYRETYDYNHQQSAESIQNHLESFIGWIEARRDFIQCKKIFGGENPEGWRGEAVDRDELWKYLFAKESTP